MLLTIVDKTPGPVLKIKFALCFNTRMASTGDITSSEYNIDNSAKVRFKFRFNNNSLLEPLLLINKHELTGNSTVKVIASCEALNYCEQFVCTYKETWNEMGELVHDSNCEHINIYHLEIQIEVFKKDLNFTKLYEDVESIDFHLKAADGSVGIHKSCLADHSDVFKAMLDGDWKETAKDCVELDGVTVQTLQHLKDFLYLGTLPEDGLRSLLLLANYYLIENLEALCIAHLVQSVTPDNFYSLLEFAFENKISELIFNVLRKTPKLNDVIQNAYKIMKTGHNPKSAMDMSALKKAVTEEPNSSPHNTPL